MAGGGVGSSFDPLNVTQFTVAELQASGRYAAIKEAAGSVDAVSDILAKCPITVLSGL